jgi:3-carboxy-cis,cis-muconate cycloisomerase
LFLSAHGALRALNEGIKGLTVDTARMRANIDALQGLVAAEALSIWLAGAIGRPAAHAAVEEMTQVAVAQGRHLRDVARATIGADPALASLDIGRLDVLFDPVAATEPAQRLARERLAALKKDIA